jgi:hypothetical protein
MALIMAICIDLIIAGINANIGNPIPTWVFVPIGVFAFILSDAVVGR